MDLYEQLVAESNVATTLDDGQLCSMLRNLPEKHARWIYAIIIHHMHVIGQGEQLQPRRGRRTLYPYGCELLPTGRGIVCILSNLPLDLQAIIRAYVSRVTVQYQ